MIAVPESAAVFWQSIDTARGDAFVTTSVIDWGRRARGQGRRRGGMIMGAMSDAPTGKKTYTHVLGAAPLSEVQRDEARVLETHQQWMIAKALSAGYPPNVALLVGYTVGSDPIKRDRAHAIAFARQGAE